MKQTFYAFLATLLISVPLFSTPMITLTGSAISGASAYKQENSEQAFRGQFEFAIRTLPPEIEIISIYFPNSSKFIFASIKVRKLFAFVLVIALLQHHCFRFEAPELLAPIIVSAIKMYYLISRPSWRNKQQ